MKFGYKLFLSSFTLIIITINIIGISLINKTVNISLESEIDKGIIQINNLLDAVNYNRENYSTIANSYFLNDVYTKIYYGQSVMYTNFASENISIEEKIMNDLESQINTYIEDEELYLAMKKNNYTVITSMSIKGIYEEKNKQIDFFIKLSLTSSLIVALILSLLVNILTRKLKRLKTSVEELEKGNYNCKIPNLGKDEIGEFAESFQKMSLAINKNIQEIERISENRKIFIGNLTHEIRTPLTSIIGYSSLIKNKKVENLDVINNYSKKIYEEGKYIENMRDKLMSLMTLETNNIELNEENISKLLKDILNDIHILYPHVKFKGTLDDKVYLKVDKTLFKSLIINLIKNSINASSEPIINIILKESYLTIEDNGKGIPEQELEKIKEPFYTLNKDRNRKNSGMGLGMPLCLQIISLHNWTVDIESKVKQGTKITIKFGG